MSGCFEMVYNDNYSCYSQTVIIIIIIIIKDICIAQDR